MLTSNDCEGGSAAFAVASPASDADGEYFGTKAFLTVSGQLHAEALAAAMARVYVLGASAPAIVLA